MMACTNKPINKIKHAHTAEHKHAHVQTCFGLTSGRHMNGGQSRGSGRRNMNGGQSCARSCGGFSVRGWWLVFLFAEC